MLLHGKRAVIYGGGGAVGRAVAEVFAREGARVFLAGRTGETLEEVAARIRAAGGTADAAEVDALDARAVDSYVDTIAKEAGGIDISFSLIAMGDVQGIPMVEMDVEDYLKPVVTSARAMFLTARAAARHMIGQGSGVILVLGGSGEPMRDYSLGGVQAAFEVMESMRRQLSAELGRYGVRVVTLRTGGLPETIPGDYASRREITEGIVEKTMLGHPATLRDVGDVAAFVASDRAGSMTAATVNISCGALVD